MRSEKMKIRMWIRTLLPFWIYFGCLAVGSFLLLAFPLVLFLLLSLAVIWLVLWAVIVYLIGGEVQRRLEYNRLFAGICQWENNNFSTGAFPAFLAGRDR